MKNVKTLQRSKNVIRGFIAAAILSLVATSAAANYLTLEIYPEHVGVFVQDGKQQFVAFGVKADGTKDNITDEVLWEVEWKSPGADVSIDGNGLATVSSTSGRAKITCTYPKAGKTMAPVNHLLLSK